MSILLWIVKMMTKVMKPFVKIAVLESLWDAAYDWAGVVNPDTTQENTTAQQGPDVAIEV